jgi:hypothetical protein
MGCDDTNVATIKDVSPETCENRCLLEPACRFFTYNLDKSKCFLKPTCEEREDKDNNFTGVKLEDAPTDPPSTPAPTTRPPVSPTPAPTLPPLSPTPAPTTAAPTLPPSPVTFEVTDGVGCDDDTLERYSDFTMEECERACEANSECRVFTFNTDNERCYLKATCDDIKLDDDNDTGVKVMFDYLYAKGCDDDDVAVIRDISEGACEEACRGDPSCRYFVFNLDNGKCFLKGACDQPKDDIDNLTGVKVAIALDLPSPDPIGENPDDPGEGALVGGWEWRDDQVCSLSHLPSPACSTSRPGLMWARRIAIELLIHVVVMIGLHTVGGQGVWSQRKPWPKDWRHHLVSYDAGNDTFLGQRRALGIVRLITMTHVW